jgi:hypothetical protein
MKPLRKPLEYIDRVPERWHVIDVMKRTSRCWDWVTMVFDVDYKTFRKGAKAQSQMVRIPGKHRNRDAACEALEDLMATRH